MVEVAPADRNRLVDGCAHFSDYLRKEPSHGGPEKPSRPFRFGGDQAHPGRWLPGKAPSMSTPDFQHISMSMVKDVALVEILTKDLQGPKMAQELGAELSQVSAQEWAKRLLVDFRRIKYLSSTGFAVLVQTGETDSGGGTASQVLQHGPRSARRGRYRSVSIRSSRFMTVRSWPCGLSPSHDGADVMPLRTDSQSSTRSWISSELARSSGAYIAWARAGKAWNRPGISARRR